MKRLFVLMLLAAVLSAPGVAVALETLESVEAFEESWTERFDQKDAASISDLLQEWREFHTSYGVEIHPEKSGTHASSGGVRSSRSTSFPVMSKRALR